MKVKKNLKEDGSVSYRMYMGNGLPHEIINGFLRNRDHRGYAPLTIKSHANDLKEFFLWLEECSLDWSTIDLIDIERYLGHLSYSANLDGTAKNANSSIRRKISSINSFYRYQTFYTGIHVSPLILKKHYAKHALVTTRTKTNHYSMIEGLRTTIVKNHVKTIKDEDYQELLKWLSNQRDKLFFTLLWETGMRVGQALQLMHSDINYHESSILINYRTNNPNLVYSKNKRPYKVFVPQFWLREYTNYLIEDSDDYDTDYLFCSIYFRDKEKRCTPLGEAAPTRDIRLYKELSSDNLKLNQSSKKYEILDNGFHPIFALPVQSALSKLRKRDICDALGISGSNGSFSLVRFVLHDVDLLATRKQQTTLRYTPINPTL